MKLFNLLIWYIKLTMEILTNIAWFILYVALTLIVASFLYAIYNRLKIKIKLYKIARTLSKSDNPKIKKIAKDLKKYSKSIPLTKEEKE